MTVQAAELTAGCPRDYADTRSVESGAGSEGMQKTSLSARYRGSYIRFAHMGTEANAKLKGVFGLEPNLV